MTEQKREPKDYEVWYVQLSDGSIEPAVAWVGGKPENMVWYIDGDSCCADPIAPVPSYELMLELVAVAAEHDCRCTHDCEEYPYTLPQCPHYRAQAALAKAKLAGLDVQS